MIQLIRTEIRVLKPITEHAMVHERGHINSERERERERASERERERARVRERERERDLLYGDG